MSDYRPSVPQNSQHRHILPAPAGSGHSSSPSPTPTDSKLATSSACNFCRKRKQKCDRGRPRCSTCTSRNIVCEYQTGTSETHSQALKRKYASAENEKDRYVQFVDLIKTKDDNEVAEILRRIRAGYSIDSILRQVEDGDLLLQLCLVPDTHRLFELPYAQEMPPILLTPDNRYLDSPIFIEAFPKNGGNTQSRPVSPVAFPQPVPSIYVKPFRAAHLFEPILDDCQPAMWTDVTDNDHLCRHLLRTYILSLYSWYPYFQKDYFLRDMQSGRARFCSPLLLNAVLAGACLSLQPPHYNGEHGDPRYLYGRFMSEARRLWEQEDDLSDGPDTINLRITRIQAALVMFTSMFVDGEDKVAWGYVEQAAAIAEQMQLGTLSSSDGIDTEEKSAQAFAAWAFYCGQATMCFHYHRFPLLLRPPEAPLPEVWQDPEFYGEVWLQYPLESRLPSNFGHVFYSMTKLRALMNEISSVLFAPKVRDPPATPDFAMIYSFYLRLQEWRRSLPEPFRPQRLALPSQLKGHMQYNLIVIRLLHPATTLAATGTSTHEIEAGQLCSRIINSAKIDLETLLRLHFLCHGHDNFDPHITPFYTNLGFYLLDDIRSALAVSPPPEPLLRAIRSSIVLVLKGLLAQGKYTILPLLLSLVLCELARTADPDGGSIYIRFSDMSNYLGTKGGAEVGAQIREKLNQAQSVTSQWPVNILSVTDNVEGRRLYELLGNSQK